MATTRQNSISPAAAVRAQRGPPPLAPAIAYAVLTLAAAVVSLHIPGPSASASAVLDYQSSHTTAVRVGGCLQLAAALPLAIWAAVIVGRLRASGASAPGTTMALAGGLLASASSALGGLITWTGAQTASLADPAVARVLGDLAFATGAAGFVVPFALLIAGVAVPSLILGLLPRALGVIGVLIALVGMLATATLLTAKLDVTVAIVRHGGLIWMLAISVLQPRAADVSPTRRGSP